MNELRRISACTYYTKILSILFSKDYNAVFNEMGILKN
jgi:hypothetical protein